MDFDLGWILLGLPVAFTLGWRTNWVKWVVFACQISYDYRNPLLSYGVDKILAALLLSTPGSQSNPFFLLAPALP